MAIVSGHGATLGFGTTSTWSPAYTSIGNWGYNRESLRTSDLSTTGTHTYIGGDLYEITPFSAPFFWDPDPVSGDPVDTLLFDSGAVSVAETVTISYPDAGSSSAAGSAHVTGWEQGELVTDTLMTGTITVQWEDAPTLA